MWRVERTSDAALWLYVGAQVALCAQRRGTQWPGDALEQPVRWGDLDSLRDGLAHVAAAVRAGLQRPDRMRLRAVVSDHWLAAAPLPWSSAHLQQAEAAHAARDHLRAWGHEPADADEIRLDDAPAGQPRLALAWPHALVQALDDFARDLGVPSVEIVALSTLLASRLVRERAGDAIAVLEPGGQTFRSATFIRRESRSGRIEQVIARNVNSEALAPWQDAQCALQRLAWGDEADAGMPCLLLDARFAGAALQSATSSVPPGWHPIDWLGDGSRSPEAADWMRWLGEGAWPASSLALSRRRTRAHVYAGTWAVAPLRRWHVVAAPAAIAFAAAGAWGSFDHLSRLRQLQAERSASADRGRATATVAVNPQRMAAVNAAIQRLNLPLDAVLASVRPPKDLRVALVGLEAAGTAQSASALKITADAASPEEMTRYVAYLADRGPFGQAELVRHEVTAGPNGLVLFRFSVEAAWRR